MIIKTTIVVHEREEVTIDPSSSGVTVGSLVDKRIGEYMTNMARVETHKHNPAEEYEIDRIQAICIEFDHIDHTNIEHQCKEGF